MSQLLRNVGRLDATARLVFVPFWLVAIGWLIHNAPVDWALSLVLFGGLVLAYALMSGALRIDPLYEAYGFSTLGERRARPPTAPPRARRRPQG